MTALLINRKSNQDHFKHIQEIIKQNLQTMRVPQPFHVPSVRLVKIGLVKKLFSCGTSAGTSLDNSGDQHGRNPWRTRARTGRLINDSCSHQNVTAFHYQITIFFNFGETGVSDQIKLLIDVVFCFEFSHLPEVILPCTDYLETWALLFFNFQTHPHMLL